jgi:hypothetical protein
MALAATTRHYIDPLLTFISAMVNAVRFDHYLSVAAFDRLRRCRLTPAESFVNAKAVARC